MALCDVCEFNVKKYRFIPFIIKSKAYPDHKMRICLKCDQEYAQKYNKIITKPNMEKFILEKRGLVIK
jgi:hypothetical protein